MKDAGPILSVFVPGIPVPQGSMTAGLTRDGRAYVRHGNPKLAGWRKAITEVVWDKVREIDPFNQTFPLSGPVAIEIEFFFPRPKSHLKANGDLTSSAPLNHTSFPDLDKLIRALFDALTSGGVWLDDKQCSMILSASKLYSDSDCPGVAVDVHRV